MNRSLQKYIHKDLSEKIVFISGPRQVGKTTLAKSLYSENAEYFNLDREEHHLLVRKNAWRRDCDLVIFDELHKLRKWKSWIKGVYDTDGVRPRLLVTGSARLDTARKGGESLAGRLYAHRLHPFSVAEVKHKHSPDSALSRLMRFGGFPEPFLKGQETFARRWRRFHVERILKEDLFDLATIKDIRSIQTLVELLRGSVGSTISYESLSRDLQISPHTVKSYVRLLESLYIIFVVTPYARNIARSLLKQPKIYFYDTGFLKEDQGARFENVVACALLKRQQFLEDTLGEQCPLHYLRDKDKREVDFLTLRNGNPEYLIEAKMSDPDVTHIRHFAPRLKGKTESIVLVKRLDRELHLKGIYIKKASRWLSGLEA